MSLISLTMQWIEGLVVSYGAKRSNLIWSLRFLTTFTNNPFQTWGVISKLIGEWFIELYTLVVWNLQIPVLTDFGHVVICWVEPLGQEGHLPHQILANYSSLYYKGGGQIMPTTLILDTPYFHTFRRLWSDKNCSREFFHCGNTCYHCKVDDAIMSRIFLTSDVH